MSYRKSFTITDDDIFIAAIGVVKRQILKISGDVMRGTRVDNLVGLARCRSSQEICLRPV